MHYHITTKLGVDVKDSGFSLDELVYRMQELFHRQAFPELLAEILMMFDAYLRLNVERRTCLPLTCGCGSGMFVLDGRRPRKIRTTIGTVDLPQLTRVKCAHCGRTCVPVVELCGLDLYQTKTAGVEKLVVEQCVQTSYRRATKAICDMTGVSVSHSTSHRWVLRTDADEIRVPEDVIATAGNPDRVPKPVTIFADGTYCKGRTDDGGARKRDVKVIVGVRQSGDVFPIGTWTGDETWTDIGNELERRKVKFADGSILVSDGEEGLAENISKLANGSFQRCHWHAVRDTYMSMWYDGGRIKDIRPVQNRLKKILAIELPKEDFERVDKEQVGAIEARMGESERALDALIADIRGRGFVKAAAYLEKARHSMFGYLRRWLALGIACPRASSLIERTMRELARRLKRIAYGWKADGLNKVSKLLLKIFSNEDEWKRYWDERMSISNNVLLYFKMTKPAFVGA